MKWTYISITIGIISFLPAFLLTGNLSISLISACVVFVLLILLNPKRRYMKAFWGLMSLFLILNRLFFEIAGKVFGIDIKISSQNSELLLSIFLLVMAGCCLLLDYKEMNPDKTLFKLKVRRKSSNQNITNKGDIEKQVIIKDNKGKIEL